MSSNISGGEQAVEAQGSLETLPNEAASQESQPETGQGQERGPSPWAKDLDELGLGDYSSVVDKYLAEKWQPRMTQLEQQYAPYKDVFQDPQDGKHAADLLYSLRQSPHDTYRLLGELIEEQYGAAESAEEPEFGAAEDQSGNEAQLPEQYQTLLDELAAEREAKAQEEEFNKTFASYQKDLPGLTEEVFAKMIIANNGDLDAAVEDIKNYFPDAAKPKEQAPPTTGEGGSSTLQEQEEEFDGDFGKIVRSVVKRANAKK